MLSRLNCAEGVMGEKSMDIDPELLQKASVLRDPEEGVDHITGLLVELKAKRDGAHGLLRTCQSEIFTESTSTSPPEPRSRQLQSCAQDYFSVTQSFDRASAHNDQVEQLWKSITPRLCLLTGPVEGMRRTLQATVGFRVT